MARFTIFGKLLTDAELIALKALIEAAGGAVGDIEVVTVIGEPDPDAENDIVLLLGTPIVCADPDLEAAFVKAANGPRRAVWVWPEDGGTTTLPPAAAKYAYSYVSWNAEKLAEVIADDDVTYFEAATGEPIPKVPTERNLCVEEEVPNK